MKEAEDPVLEAWWKGLIMWYNRQDYLSAMECWEDALSLANRRQEEDHSSRRLDYGDDEEDDDEDRALEAVLELLGNKRDADDPGAEDGGDCEKPPVSTAPLWLFLAGCQLDARRYADARRSLLRCLRDEGERPERGGSGSPGGDNDSSKLSITHRALAEWIASREEEEAENGSSSRNSSSSSVSFRTVRMALNCRVPNLSWADPYQRPGFVYPQIAPHQKPVYDPGDFEWCRALKAGESEGGGQPYRDIREEFLRAFDGGGGGGNFYPVGAGTHRDGAGEHDGDAVAGGGWSEFVLFGAGAAAAAASRVAPATCRWVRRNAPDAVSLAEAGGGEVIFSVLAPNTRIRPHCGTTNLRLTAHLGLVVPPTCEADAGEVSTNTVGRQHDHQAKRCRIRVADQWLTWEEGKVIVFDDSYEHEVENSTDSVRAVLLLRFWHPCLPRERREEALQQALEAKRREEIRRYNPPMPPAPDDDAVAHRSRCRSFRLRANEESTCPNCWSTGYQSIRVESLNGSSNDYYPEKGNDCYGFVCTCGQRI